MKNFVFIKVALQYIFNVFILFKTVSYLKHNFKLKIDPKMCTFKNLEEIWKTWKHFSKNKWQPCSYVCGLKFVVSKYLAKLCILLMEA